jgi:hypothetical protein
MSPGLHDHLIHDHLIYDHLIHDHGRDRQEIERLPLAAIHRFEHLEQAMGLLDLDHAHAELPDSVRPEAA